MNNWAHPTYRDALRDYFERALKRGGQTRHLLEEAFSRQDAFRKHGTMKDAFAKQRATAAVAL